MTKYGVQAGGLSDKIYVGRINAAGTEFTDKADLTAEVLHAVGQWAEQNHGGSAWVEIGGKRIEIDVTPTEHPADADADADAESDRGAA